MAKDMDPTKILAQYELFKRRREEKKVEEAKLEQAQSETKAFWAAKAEIAGKVVTVRKPHVCVECAKIILKGERATVKAKFGNVGVNGWTAGFTSEYTCTVCKPIQEA